MTGARRPTRIGRSTALLVIAAIPFLAACRATGSPPVQPSPSAAVTSPTMSGSPTPSSTPPSASPGRPYDAEGILAVMRDSHRPDSLPATLQTDAVAAAIAAEAWTWDGRPWDGISVSGSCGPSTCNLELAGASTDAAGTDLYSFSIDLESGMVSLTATDLHGYPIELEPAMDATARAGVPVAELDGLALVAARWLPPPRTDAYWLSYRSGGEEGARALDVLVDLSSGEVLETKEPAG